MNVRWPASAGSARSRVAAGTRRSRRRLVQERSVVSTPRRDLRNDLAHSDTSVNAAGDGRSTAGSSHAHMSCS
ncbi:hypothetical protein C8039_09075 [Halogeometricum sp. wsp3]|nr:hypothetical protein C8039_09075 [Halogeometricum sp. wsp3]